VIYCVVVEASQFFWTPDNFIAEDQDEGRWICNTSGNVAYKTAAPQHVLWPARADEHSAAPVHSRQRAARTPRDERGRAVAATLANRLNFDQVMSGWLKYFPRES
jgi:hypothetical protein